jgi:hypothetical protein
MLGLLECRLIQRGVAKGNLFELRTILVYVICKLTQVISWIGITTFNHSHICGNCLKSPQKTIYFYKLYIISRMLHIINNVRFKYVVVYTGLTLGILVYRFKILWHIICFKN